MDIGNNIKIIRKKKNMTQEDLSKGICTQSQVSKIEKGEIIPLASLLVKLAERLSVSIDSLVYGEDILKSNFNLDKKRINTLLRNREYETINNIIRLIDIESLAFTDSIYISYLSIMTKSYINKSSGSSELEELFLSNEYKVDSELKISMLNSLGIFNMDDGNLKKAKEYLLKGYKLSFQSKEYEDLSFKVSYNYLRLLYHERNYQEIYEVANKLLEFVFITCNICCYSELVYYKVSALLQLNIISLIDSQEIDAAIHISIKKGDIRMKQRLEDLKNKVDNKKV